MAEFIDQNNLDHAQDPPGHMPSLAQREPEETDLDDDSFRSCKFQVAGFTAFPSDERRTHIYPYASCAPCHFIPKVFCARDHSVTCVFSGHHVTSKFVTTQRSDRIPKLANDGGVAIELDAHALFNHFTFQQVRLGEGQRAQQPGSALETISARASTRAARAIADADPASKSWRRGSAADSRPPSVLPRREAPATAS